MTVGSVRTLWSRIAGTSVLALISLVSLGAGPAQAAEGVAFQVEGISRPSYLKAGMTFQGANVEQPPTYRVGVRDIGAQSAEGVNIGITLPEGVEPSPSLAPEVFYGSANQPCISVGQVVTCEVPAPMQSGGEAYVLIPLDVSAEGSDLGQTVVNVTSAGGSSHLSSFATSASSPTSGIALEGEFGVHGGAYGEAGEEVEAGRHPYVVTAGFNVPTVESEEGKASTQISVQEPLRNIMFALPAGLVINPESVLHKCARFEAEGQKKGIRCPAESQVGVAHFDVLNGLVGLTESVYVLQTAPNVPAELVFGIAGVNVYLKGGLDGEFHLTAESREILARYNIPGVTLELWGNPSAPQHDWARKGQESCSAGCSVPASRAPFITMPSACTPSLRFTAEVVGWLGGMDGREGSFANLDGSTQDVTGCEKLPFDPTVSISPGSTAADRPTGLGVRIAVPQNEDPFGLASATVKRVAVELPPGMRVNPPAANGLEACSPAQIGLGDVQPAGCPDASKLGSAEIETPLLDVPLRGSVYLAQQRVNPFGTLLALYLAVEGKGIVLKLPGRVDADSQTGQLTAIFDNNPQLPFNELRVQLNGGDGGPRATLVTPPACGSYSARTEITSWASPVPVVLENPVNIDQGCSSEGFTPGFTAGTVNPIAGAYSAFTLQVTRHDNEENLSRIPATLPEGLLAKLASIPLCAESEAATGDCPTGAQVGTTTTGVGAGSQPLYIPQPGKSPTGLYLSGPYKGAPYSLVVKVPAQAGPFDLGTIAVRVALNVDPSTAQVTAVSDPLPQILEGIPVAYRDVRVDVTRPEFVVNPTSCQPMKVGSSIISTSGAQADPTARFQVSGCERLPFKPKLKLQLKGSMQRTKNPAVRAVLTQPKGQANIGRVTVVLPESEFIDNRHINNPCTRAQFNAGAGNGAECPASSILGFARAFTPLLDRPVEGPVYFRSNGGERELPDLVASLHGQVNVNLVGYIDSVRANGVSRIRNTFATVPDVPVTRFVLNLKGGNKGLLQNSTNLCKARNVANIKLHAQSGKTADLSAPILTDCKGKNKGRKRGEARK